MGRPGGRPAGRISRRHLQAGAEQADIVRELAAVGISVKHAKQAVTRVEQLELAEVSVAARVGGASAATPLPKEGVACCPTCQAELRRVKKGGQPTGETLCVHCREQPESCPFCGVALRTPAARQCRSCRRSWHSHGGDAAPVPAGDDVAKPPAGHAYVAVRADGTEAESWHSAAEGYLELTAGMQEGIFNRQTEARFIPANCTATSAVKWTTLERAARQVPQLDRLYRAVWSFTARGATIGALVGIALKYLDTTVTMFAVDVMAGLIWLAIGCCLAASGKYPKLGWAPLGIWVFLRFQGVELDLCAFGGALASTVAIGAIFGVPSGMVVGTVVGYACQGGQRRAHDADPEGMRPLVLGLVVPLLVVLTLAYVYVFHVMPWMFDWLESQPA